MDPHPALPDLEATLARPIAGRGLSASTLGEEIGDARTLLVFLRHLG